jgi:hypothetical protein
MARLLTLILFGELMQACTGFEGASDTLNPSGPASLRAVNYELKDLPRSTGEIGLFELAYAAALSDAQYIAKGDLQPATTSSDPTSVRSRRMAFEGVHLADSYCALFFAYGSDNQKWLLVSKDIVAALGTIATGAVALASPHNATAAGAIALGTAALYSGVDVYTRNFLFNTDNIESVRVMTMNALSAHATKALPENDTSIWTFSGAAEVINEHQSICSPASIRSLVLEAIKGGKFIAAPPAGQGGAAGSPKTAAAIDAATAAVPAAITAAAAAAPAAAAAAVPAAAAGAAAAGPAAAAAAAIPGANTKTISDAARRAAEDGAKDAAQNAAPTAPPKAVQAVANAVANAVAPAATAGAQTGPSSDSPGRPLQAGS